MLSDLPKRKRVHSENHHKPGRLVPGRRLLIWAVVVLLSGSVLLNYFLAKRLVVSKKTIVKQRQVLAEVREPEDHRSEIAGRWYGLCPKNSIHSVEDFHRIVKGDPLLAQHFSDFAWEKARMGKLEEAVWTHVTYRKDGRIRTTRKVIRLPKGDGYITDGNRWVRTYCGNDYVLAESSDAIRERIDSDADRLRERAANSTRKPGDLQDADDIDVIPEPGTFVLMATGMACLGLTRLRKRH